jgi:hypothetical protein
MESRRVRRLPTPLGKRFAFPTSPTASTTTTRHGRRKRRPPAFCVLKRLAISCAGPPGRAGWIPEARAAREVRQGPAASPCPNAPPFLVQGLRAEPGGSLKLEPCERGGGWRRPKPSRGGGGPAKETLISSSAQARPVVAPRGGRRQDPPPRLSKASTGGVVLPATRPGRPPWRSPYVRSPCPAR